MNKMPKRTYMTWQVSEISSSSDEEQAHMIFMVSHVCDDDEVSNNKPSYEELHDAFSDLHDECLKLSRLCTKQKKTISSLKSKSNNM